MSRNALASGSERRLSLEPDASAFRLIGQFVWNASRAIHLLNADFLSFQKM